MQLTSTATIEIVDGCHLKCDFCYNFNRTPSFKQIKLDLVEKFIDKYDHYLWRKGYTSWGEPLLHREFVTIAKMVNGTNSDLYTSFSFAPLPDRYFEAMNNFARVGVSLTGLTQDVYDLCRHGGNLEWVMTNVKRLSEIIDKTKTRVSIFFLTHKDNEHQLKEAEELFTGMGFRFTASRLFYPIEGLLEGVNYPYLKDKKYSIQRRRSICRELRNPRINVDGNHVLCCGTRNVPIDFTIDDDVPQELLIETKMKHPLCEKCREHQYWRMVCA
jgi:MoaA/NifB/PqqE/SkfB family radical SAM enzyme